MLLNKKKHFADGKQTRYLKKKQKKKQALIFYAVRFSCIIDIITKVFCLSS